MIVVMESSIYGTEILKQNNPLKNSVILISTTLFIHPGEFYQNLIVF